MDDCFDNDEFSHIAIDATIRILRRVRGQADYRASADVRAAAPIPDVDAKRRILTVLGRTSTVLMFSLVKDEASCFPIFSATASTMRNTHEHLSFELGFDIYCSLRNSRFLHLLFASEHTFIGL